MNVGEYVDFNYTGAIQTYTIENSGIYKLEVWGSKGGNRIGGGGSGGYSIGYKKLKKGTNIYVVCGGINYNGGGSGGSYMQDSQHEVHGASGGGATHIALVTGTLSSIGKVTFDQQGLIVAGGGSGGWYGYYLNESERVVGSGRAGGGTSGGGINPGTQIGGYAFGQGQSWGYNGSWTTGCGAGGGGYYGGYGSMGTGQAGGGSGWIGGVDDYKDNLKSTTQGINNDNGKAKLTLIKKSNKKYGNLDVVCYYGAEEMERHFGTLDI